MATTSSLSWPQMFDVARNRVAVITDNESIVNRCKLLMLTGPNELYNNPTFGVGLNQYLFQYNDKNMKSIIRTRIISQLREHEPCVNADMTHFADELMFSGQDDNDINQYNKLSMTVGLSTTFGDTAVIDLIS